MKLQVVLLCAALACAAPIAIAQAQEEGAGSMPPADTTAMPDSLAPPDSSQHVIINNYYYGYPGWGYAPFYSGFPFYGWPAFSFGFGFPFYAHRHAYFYGHGFHGYPRYFGQSRYGVTRYHGSPYGGRGSGAYGGHSGRMGRRR